jgi:hypothetical protein
LFTEETFMLNDNPQPDADAALLASLEGKCQLIRDRVRGVVAGYSNGFYLHGPGGTSKSHTVVETLDALGARYKLANTRLTAKGLFDRLEEFPDQIHLLEDAEPLFKDQHAAGILRAALWGPQGADGKQERVVQWGVDKKKAEFLFTGGVIITANLPLDDVPQLDAVRGRITHLYYQPTDDEIQALMRKIAAGGHRHGPHTLPPQECLEVVRAVVGRSQKMKRNLDLRLMVNAFRDRLQWENGEAETHWEDLLESRMQEKVVAPARGPGLKAQEHARELDVLRRIIHLPRQERLDAWKRETGKSQPTMYRRMADFGLSDSQLSHSLPPLKVEVKESVLIQPPPSGQIEN